jgi:hypothetical protein
VFCFLWVSSHVVVEVELFGGKIFSRHDMHGRPRGDFVGGAAAATSNLS